LADLRIYQVRAVSIAGVPSFLSCFFILSLCFFSPIFTFPNRKIKDTVMRKYLYVLALVFLLCSCRKDSDTEAPVITLQAPVENSQYQAYGDIEVKGTVTDNRQLASVRIQLLDMNLTPALPSLQLSPEGKSVQLNHAYPLHSLHLVTGEYYLLVQAGDGVQSSNRYVKVFVHAAPREFRFLLAVTRSGTQLRVLQIDTALQVSTKLNLQADYMRSACNSKHGQFYIIGRHTGQLAVYDVNDWLLKWNVPVVLNPPFAWFSGFMLRNGYAWAGYQAGRYEKYNAYGSQLSSVNTASTWSPQKFCIAGDKLLVEEKNQAGPERMISVYYESTGTPAGDTWVNGAVVELFMLSETIVCIIYNDVTGQARLVLYNVPANTSWEPSSVFDPGRALCAIQVGPDVLIGHESGLYRFVAASATLFQIVPGLRAGALFYDDDHQHIFAAEHTTLKQYISHWPSWPPCQLVNTLPLSDTILAVHGVYNKD
jgi:hypothetical protein